MGYGKVGVSKERMCSYKHTHNSAVHINSKIVASGGHGYAYINKIDIRTGKSMNPNEIGKMQYQYFNECGEPLKIRRKLDGEFEEGEGEFLTPYVKNNYIPGAFPNYSTYIGPNNPTIIQNGEEVPDYRREPTDIVDAAALRHDKAYDKKKASGLDVLSALRVLDADRALFKEAQNIIDAVKENPNFVDKFTGKPISQKTLEKARTIVWAFEIIINRKEERLSKGEKPEVTPE